MLKLFPSVYFYLNNYHLLLRNLLFHRMDKSIVQKIIWLVKISQLVNYFMSVLFSFIISISAKDIRYGIIYMKLIRKYFVSWKFEKQNQLVLLLSLGQIETVMQFDCHYFLEICFLRNYLSIILWCLCCFDKRLRYSWINIFSLHLWFD